jgi:hypothetical protein
MAGQTARLLRHFPLGQNFIDKSLLRPVMDDNRNSHRAETEIGLRFMGSPPDERTTHRRSVLLWMFQLEQPVVPAPLANADPAGRGGRPYAGYGLNSPGGSDI